MLHVKRAQPTVPEVPVTVGAGMLADGLAVTHVLDGGVAYLSVHSHGLGDPLTLLLATNSTSLSGLTMFSGLGRLHAHHWASVWGKGHAPETGVGASSGDLRFRREEHAPAVDVGPSAPLAATGPVVTTPRTPGEQDQR